MIKSVRERIYSDFLMPSRLNEYETLLNRALQRKYVICSIEYFWDIYHADNYNGDTKYLILRHDVDTDVTTAKEMFKIEQKLGVSASYYFRLSTIDISFMKRLHNCGSEASYHYEEIATYAKTNHIKDPQTIFSDMNSIQSLFSLNFENLKNLIQIPMRIVAAHGDFVNRYLQIPNQVLLNDFEFRNKNGIILEVYDDKLTQLITNRYSDTTYPLFWNPTSPLPTLDGESKVVYLLTHPRHWRVNIKENLKDDINRIVEGLFYKVT